MLKSLRSIPFLFVILSLAVLTRGSGQEPRTKRNEELVRSFVGAFNDRDFDKLTSLAHENVEWLSIAGSRIAVEASGQLALFESLEAYFDACPSCHSELEWVESVGSRVATLERAMWTDSSGEKSQVSLAVYDIEEGMIRRVYYYPAEESPPDEPRNEGGGTGH